MTLAESPTRTKIDPVLLAVMQGALNNIQHEMTVTLRQSGRSTVATVARDYSNAIFDHNADMILQGEDLPAHLGSLMAGMKGVSQYFGDDVHEGDVFYHSDPTYGGSHIDDMCAYKPIFVDGELAFWAVSKLHVVDVGGPVAGGYNSTATEIYAEGLRIPPIRLIDRGKLREDVFNMILINVRTNQNQAGDIRAQIGAVGVAERRLKELCAKYGLAQTRECCAEIQSLAEKAMRSLLAGVPDGVGVGTSVMEDTGHGLGDMTITATARIEGDELFVSLSAPPQIPYYMNSYKSNTQSGVFFGLIMWAQLEPPYNAGFYRAVNVDYGPEGTIVNAKEPAAHMMSTSVPNENVGEAVRAALNAILPRRAMAQWCQTFAVTMAGIDPRSDAEFVSLHVASLMGGAGAIAETMDGWSVLGPAYCLGACMTGETEITETLLPVIIHEFGFREDSAGPGRWRGGVGNRMVIEPLDTMTIATIGQGYKEPSAGALGAENLLAEEKIARSVIVREDGTREAYTEAIIKKLSRGERYVHLAPGGGGVGDAFTRPADLVADDVANGFLTVRGAEIEYGVVVDPETLAVSEDATAALRSSRGV